MSFLFRSTPASAKPAATDAKKTIAIVGSGFCGIPTFNQLADRVDKSSVRIVLITPRSYFLHLPASLRMLTTSDESFVDKVLMPLTPWFSEGNNEVVYGKVASITSGFGKRQVTLESGKVVDWDYLVLAPGSSWEGALAFPDTKEETVDMVKVWRQRFEKARDIVVAGGGGVAFELAGEFKDEWPKTNVTLVHGQTSLLKGVYPDYWRTQVNESMRKRGVELVLGDRLEQTEPNADGTVTTRSGKVINADLVLSARGSRPNTKFISDSLGKDALTPSGHILVEPTLQVKGHPSIFAGGDAIDWKTEQKSAFKAFKHSTIISENIAALIKNPSAPLTKYAGEGDTILLTNGANGGTSFVAKLGGLAFGDFFTRQVASKNLYVSEVRNKLRL